MSRLSATLALVIGIFTITVPTFLLFQAVTFLFLVPLVLGGGCILLAWAGFRSESPLSRHMGWIALVLMLVAVGLPFGIIAHDRRLGYPVVLVVPNGYRGPLKLVVDPRNGVDVPLTNGAYTYLFPSSGILVIKDGSPFCQWHTQTVVYANGRRIPNEEEQRVASDGVSVHSLGFVSITENGKQETFKWFFVGTEAERRKYADRP